MDSGTRPAGGGHDSVCSEDGCSNKVRRRGLCYRHCYPASQSAGRVNPPGWRGQWVGAVCSVDGCDNAAVCKGLCDSHYGKARWAAGYRPPAKSTRNRHLKHRYGIDHDEYDRLLAEQDGRCAICQRTPSAGDRPKHWKSHLCVDHCHATGVVRGLLCNDCNLAIAGLGTADTARRAAEYLERWD